MLVYEIDPLVDLRWAQFTSNHPSASVFHTTGWLRALSLTYGYKPAVLTTTEPGRPLNNGIAFCRINSLMTGARLVSLPFSDHCEPLVENAKSLAEVGRYLNNLVGSHQLKYAEIRPVTEIADTEHGIGMEAAESFSFHTLDLTPALPVILQRCDSSCVRRRIRRAGREGLLVTHGRDEETLRVFYRLLVLTRRRHQLPPQPIAWFRNVLTSLGEAATISVAYKNDQAIASILTLNYKRKVMYKYGCSDAAFHNLGGMPLLLWDAIQSAKDKGATEFDFGRSESDNAGLIDFKDNWGTTRSQLTYYRYPNRAPRLSAATWGAGAIRKAFFSLPDFCLAAAGRVLYRHVG